MDLVLQDQPAIVTAASAGLGYATALALAHEGAHVALCSRDGKRAQDAADLVHPTRRDVFEQVEAITWEDDDTLLIGNEQRDLFRVDIDVLTGGWN